MADKAGFVMYKQWGVFIKKMNVTQKAELLESIFSYQCGEEYEIQDNAVDIIFCLIKEQFDKDNDKYEEISEIRANARRKKTNDNKCKQMETSVPDKELDKDKDKELDKDKDKDKEYPTDTNKEKRKRFTPPTVEEVRAYCQERNCNVDPNSFVDFYTSKGWKVGSASMKDWKAAVRTWEKRDRASPKSFDPVSYMLEGGYFDETGDS